MSHAFVAIFQFYLFHFISNTLDHNIPSLIDVFCVKKLKRNSKLYSYTRICEDGMCDGDLTFCIIFYSPLTMVLKMYTYNERSFLDE